jgi:uncharacterized damage-inducible protein DinB
MDLLAQQYELIQDTRQVLFDYCQTMQPEHLIKNVENFGGRSIAYLLVHTSSTYRFWLGHFTNIRHNELTNADAIFGLAEIKSLYQETDELVNSFCNISRARLRSVSRAAW